MSLSGLPNELVQLVADNLVHECDINAFSKANRRLYGLLNPYLYLYNAEYSDGAGLPSLCRCGCTSLVRMMLDAGAPLDACDDQDFHPMGLAAQEGHAEIVELFLQRDVLTSGDILWPNSIYGHDVGPAIAAVSHEPVLRVMSAYGLDPSDPLLLCSAARGPSLAAVKFLAGLTSDLNGGEPRGDLKSTPLANAVTQGNIEIVPFLIDAGADPNAGDKKGILTPICISAMEGNMDITRTLIAGDANLKVTAPNGGCTFLLLVLAAICGHVSVVKLFLEHIDFAAGEGNQPLLLTTGAACGLMPLVKQALSEGCDADSVYNKIEIYNAIEISHYKIARTPLAWAAKNGHTEIIGLLLQYGADPNGGQDPWMIQRPLCGAIDGKHEKAVQALLDKGANPNVDTGYGCLLLAAARHTPILQSLLGYGADPLRVETEGCYRYTGETPMLKILGSGNILAVQALLDSDVPLISPMLREHTFANVVQYAAKGGVEMLKILAMRGNFPEQRSESEKLAIKTAAFKGNAAVVEFFLHDRGFGSDKNLLRDLAMIVVEGASRHPRHKTSAALDLIISYGLDLDTLSTAGDDGDIPFLYEMIVAGRPRSVQLLLEKGANPLVTVYYGGSDALEGAIVRKETEIVRYLLQALDSRWTTLRECEYALGRAGAFADMEGNGQIQALLENFYWRKKNPVSQ